MSKIIISWFYYSIMNILFNINSLRKLHFFYIHRRVKFTGSRGLFIGNNSLIGDNSWININNPSKGTFKVGCNCCIGMDNFITVGGDISIGDYFLSGKNCSLISSSHNVEDPNKPYLKTGTTFNHKISIGSNVFFGFGVTVIGDVSIGSGSVIGACSVVTKSIPNYSMAVGNPAKIIKRYSFKKKQWVSINDYNSQDIEPKINIKFDRGFYHPIAALRKNKNVY